MNGIVRRARFGMLQMRCGDFIKKWPGSDKGPAALVLTTPQFDDGSILYCLREAFNALSKKPNDPELVATLVFLLKLSEIPADARADPLIESAA